MKKILIYVLFIMLGLAAVAKMTGKDPPTFSYFLRVLQDTKGIEPSAEIIKVSLGDWGPLNFIRNFVREVVDELNLIAYFGQYCLCVITYIFNVLRALIPYFFGIGGSPNVSPTPVPGGGGGSWSLLLI